MESALFGLFENPVLATLDEAEKAYRFLQDHRDQILRYETTWGLNPDGRRGKTRAVDNRTGLEAVPIDFGPILGYAGLPPGTAPTLEWTFNPAKAALFEHLRSRYSEIADRLGDENPFMSTNIYLGGGVLDASRYEVANTNFANGVPDILLGLEGEVVADALIGGKGDDILIGEAGNDRLEGGPGADILIGGTGQDTYVWNAGEGPGEDRVIDEDRSGEFVFRDAAGNAMALSGPYEQVDATTWRNVKNPTVQLTHPSSWILTLPDGSTVNLGTDFQWGDFDINFWITTPDPQPTLTIAGDLTPVEPEQYDALGNLVTDPNQPDPDRADVLNGRDNQSEGDLIQSKGGDDVVAAKAGDDKVEAGTGSDIVNAGEGNDLVLGGPDLDLLWGLAGNDRLYAEAEVDLQTAIAQGETDLPTGTKGELMDGGEGEDILVGGPGNDALVGGGGTGANVILGGAGDDLLLGHVRITTAAREWTVTRTVQQGAGGTQYLWGFTNATTEQDSTPSDDALYGGQGNDWLFGGQGNDVLDGGTGEDVLFGADGADVLVGGTDKDVLVGEQGDDFLSGDARNETLEGEPGTTPCAGRETKLSCGTRNCSSQPAHKQLVRFSIQCGGCRWAPRKSAFTLRGGLL
jgi:Ca2+-binding RTX toxin-like protein